MKIKIVSDGMPLQAGDPIPDEDGKAVGYVEQVMFGIGESGRFRIYLTMVLNESERPKEARYEKGN